MSDTKLWEGALEGADYEKVALYAEEVPKTLSEISTSDSGTSIRDAGLVLTKEDIIKIKRYVSIAFTFPQTHKDVVDYLRYGTSEDGGVGLKPENFLSTFQLIRQHAETWADLRAAIKGTATDLESFGTAMRIWGQGMDDFYKSDVSVQLIKEHGIKTYEDLKTLEYNWEGVFPGIELQPGTVGGLAGYLEDIKEDVVHYRKRTNEIKEGLERFGNELESRIIPEIKVRLEFIGQNKYPDRIFELNKTISERAADIERLNLEYKALVERSIASAATFNIFGLGMAIYLGVEAENIRSERKRLNNDQENDVQSLKSKNLTLGSLKRVEHDLQNCKIAAVEADYATSNLRYVWFTINEYIDQSAEKINKINDALALSRFISTFKLVVASWIKVESNAGQLVQVFVDADKEYSEESNKPLIAFSRKSAMVENTYPSLDASPLSSSKVQMSDDLAKATVLSQQLNYLPELNNQFSRLVGNVFDGIRTLQQSAQFNMLKFEGALQELAVLDGELATAPEKDEEAIRQAVADKVSVLKGALGHVEEKYSAISACYKNISAFFDQSQTQKIENDLKDDIDRVQARVATLNEVLGEYRASQKVIDDAVREVEKTNIDSLGKDVGLSIDKLKNLGMAPTEAQLVMLAVEQLQKAIEGIVKDVSFLSMLRSSKVLRDKVAGVVTEIDELKANITRGERKVMFIQTVHRMEEQRRLVASEYKKAVDSFSRFIERCGHGTDREWVGKCQAEIELFLVFLRPVSKI